MLSICLACVVCAASALLCRPAMHNPAPWQAPLQSSSCPATLSGQPCLGLTLPSDGSHPAKPCGQTWPGLVPPKEATTCYIPSRHLQLGLAKGCQFCPQAYLQQLWPGLAASQTRAQPQSIAHPWQPPEQRTGPAYQCAHTSCGLASLPAMMGTSPIHQCAHSSCGPATRVEHIQFIQLIPLKHLVLVTRDDCASGP